MNRLSIFDFLEKELLDRKISPIKPNNFSLKQVEQRIFLTNEVQLCFYLKLSTAITVQEELKNESFIKQKAISILTEKIFGELRQELFELRELSYEVGYESLLDAKIGRIIGLISG